MRKLNKEWFDIIQVDHIWKNLYKTWYGCKIPYVEEKYFRELSDCIRIKNGWYCPWYILVCHRRYSDSEIPKRTNHDYDLTIKKHLTTYIFYEHCYSKSSMIEKIQSSMLVFQKYISKQFGILFQSCNHLFSERHDLSHKLQYKL
jgi:hypothetical protein